MKRQLEATEEKYLKMTRSQHEGLDQNQITIDNRVYNDLTIISNILHIMFTFVFLHKTIINN